MTTPTPPEGHEPVSIHETDRWMLREWGFPVRGSVTTHDEAFKGDDIWVARHKAVRAGFCFNAPSTGETPWVGQLKVSTDQRADGMQLLAWLVSTDRYKGPKK